MRVLRLLAGLLFASFACGAGAQQSILEPRNVAIVVNEADPTSVDAGEYYREAHGIPARNVVRVKITGSPRVLSAGDFRALKRSIDSALSQDIDVVLMAWTAPYAVECNSITAAYTLGLDMSLCANTCAPAKANPYFDTIARRPYREIGMRLSMLLPSEDAKLARAIADRGRLSGFRLQEASAYFVVTGDKARNNRAVLYPPSQRIASRLLDVQTLRADGIEDRNDVMIYEIGAVSVPYLDTLTFLPGALADHMTSAGGDLLGQSQMSSLKWLEAGATASYGTVSEPCSHWQKFPHPAVLLKHYLQGARAVEAYWKSVAWPAQGVFIGDPLAAPYCTRCSR